MELGADTRSGVSWKLQATYSHVLTSKVLVFINLTLIPSSLSKIITSLSLTSCPGNEKLRITCMSFARDNCYSLQSAVNESESQSQAHAHQLLKVDTTKEKQYNI
ncbi:hypothetical protein ACFX15_005581 [Malus domestica]